MFSPPVKRSPQFGKRRWFQDILRQIPAPQRAAAGGWEPLRHANAEPELRMLRHAPSMRAHSRSCRSSIRDDRFMLRRFSAWSSRANVPRAFAWSIDGTIAALSSATVFPAKSEKYEQRTAAEPVFGTDRIAPLCHQPIHCAPRHHIKRSKGCGGAFITVICLISG